MFFCVAVGVLKVQYRIITKYFVYTNCIGNVNPVFSDKTKKNVILENARAVYYCKIQLHIINIILEINIASATILDG